MRTWTATEARPGKGGVVGRLLLGIVLSVVIGALVAGLAVPFAVLAGWTARSTADGLARMPKQLEFRPLSERSVMTDRTGHVVATWFRKNRVVVPLDEVSPWMRKAVVAIEDSRFYEHGAMDLQGTLRAFVRNRAAGGTVQGGSTLTQQLVKLTLLENAETPEERAAATRKSYQRKFRELRFALALEKHRSKHWILERYLNTAYFGDGAYGVEAAAEHYFGRKARKLNVQQSAMLAGLVKNPNGYDPVKHPRAARARRDLVLTRMADLGMIAQSRAQRERRRDPPLHVRRTPNGCLGSKAPVFCTYVRQWVVRNSKLAKVLGKDRSGRLKALRTAGLRIRTTLDLPMQRVAHKAVRHHVRPRDKAVGALALVEPGTGKVRAVTQSRPIGTRAKRGETFINYAVPRKYGHANGFQAGSTFKPFVLAAALQQGMPLTTQIQAPPKIRLRVDRFRGCDGRLTSDKVWTPSNSTGSGLFDLRTGTRQSVNTFFAQLELRTGLCRPYHLARTMGVRLTDPDSQMVPSFTLGVVDTDPLTMASAYATFAAGGRYCRPRPVLAVRTLRGKLVHRYSDSCHRVLPKAVADGVNAVLRGVQEPGGFGYEAGLGLRQPSAGKTGTTQRGSAVWFAGYTPDLAGVSVIAGVDRQGRWLSLNGRTVGGKVIPHASGSGTAGPVWGEAMQRLQHRIPDHDFVDPPPRIVRGSTTVVPDVRGLTVDRARAALRDAGLGVLVEDPCARAGARGPWRGWSRPRARCWPRGGWFASAPPTARAHRRDPGGRDPAGPDHAGGDPRAGRPPDPAGPAPGLPPRASWVGARHQPRPLRCAGRRGLARAGQRLHARRGLALPARRRPALG